MQTGVGCEQISVLCEGTQEEGGRGHNVSSGTGHGPHLDRELALGATARAETRVDATTRVEP